MVDSELKRRIESMEQICLDMATYKKNSSYEQYEAARGELMSNIAVLRYLPKWLIECRAGSHFWQFIKEKFSTYEERRKFLWEEFAATHKGIERIGIDATADSVADILTNCNSDSVHDAWRKCIERRNSDPEGAITSARTMVEATCKIILDQIGENPESTDLPKLYKQVAKSLRLSPDQHNEQVFKQILTGCTSAVEGLGSMRNSLSDAHGQGMRKVKPTRRHAELAVNLAGTVCAFLMATYEELISRK